MNTQLTLIETYEQRLSQSSETTPEWHVYRDVLQLMYSTLDASPIKEQIRKLCEQCNEYAEQFGHYYDTDCGTYQKYMHTKIRLYQVALDDMTEHAQHTCALSLLPNDILKTHLGE